MTTSRNFDAVLRVIDSLQLTADHTVATPVNRGQGHDVIIAGSKNNEQAKELFGAWTCPSHISDVETYDCSNCPAHGKTTATRLFDKVISLDFSRNSA